MLDAKTVLINESQQRMPRLFWRTLPAVHVLDGAGGLRPVLLGLGKTALAVITNVGTVQEVVTMHDFIDVMAMSNSRTTLTLQVSALLTYSFETEVRCGLACRARASLPGRVLVQKQHSRSDPWCGA